MSRLDGPSVAAPSIAAKPTTPGAGVDPNKVIRPSKRIKAWHRDQGQFRTTLKAFARTVSKIDGPNGQPIAKRWLASKGLKP